MNTPFKNPWPHKTHGLADILRWKLGIGGREKARIPEAPNHPATSIALDPSQIAQIPEQGSRVTWLGHASFLIQGAGKSLLIDPIFSDHCFPFPFPSLRRKVAPPCLLSELPKIDAILLTHSHYDHLDLHTLLKIGQSTPLYLPSGHAAFLKKSGFSNVTELAWWESHEFTSDIRITAVPGQHFTARTLFDRNSGHWCGWVIQGGKNTLWHAGDSGYCPAFSEIGERFGGIDLAMIPIGSYQPRSIMQSIHMNPDEAVQAFIDARCQRAIGMHWGTFQLTDEPMGEPPILLKEMVQQRLLPADSFVTGRVGEIWETSF